MLKVIGLLSDFPEYDVGEDYIFIDDDTQHFIKSISDHTLTPIESDIDLSTKHQILQKVFCETTNNIILNTEWTKKLIYILENDVCEEYYILGEYFIDKKRFTFVYKISTFGEFNIPIVSKWKKEIENHSRYTIRK